MTHPEIRPKRVVALVVWSLLWAGVAAAQDEAKWQAAMRQAASARQSGRVEEAEKTLQAALEEAEKFGAEDQRVLVTLDALGTYYYTKSDFAAALSIYTRMLEIRERVVGPSHILVANALNNVAVIEAVLKKFPEAEAHGQRAVQISEQATAGVSDITAVTAGANHTCIITGNGRVRCWGGNLDWQLGVPSPAVAGYPIELAEVNGAVALAAGNTFTCALLADRNVTCWGSNKSGQAGPPAGAWTSPRAVAGVSGARAVAAGAEHACALLEDGSVKCWGDNQRGQMGNGSVAAATSPALVPGIKGVTALAAGGNHSCAALADGSVSCWGVFFAGAEPLVHPVRVPGLSGNVTSLAAGSNYACALLSDGNVSCWWGAKPAPPGAAPAPPFTPPDVIKGAAPAQAVAAGYAHTCALLTDGSVRCWGNNREGQLGNGQTVHSPSPVAVQNLKGATALAAGIAHTCALLSDKTVQCWGTDSYGAPPGVLYGFRSHAPLRMGRDDGSLLTSLNILADVFRSSAKYDKAEPLYLRSIQLNEKLRGPDNDSLAPTLNGYAEMLRKAGRAEDAAKIEARAQSILFKPTLTDVPSAPPTTIK
jgi:alpha-tubulin suppressor-like RCC1 family protein